MRETNARVFIIYARFGGEVFWKATVTFAQPRNPNHLRSSTTATAIIIRTISFPIPLSYEHEQQQQHNGNFNSQFTQCGLFGFS